MKWNVARVFENFGFVDQDGNPEGPRYCLGKYSLVEAPDRTGAVEKFIEDQYANAGFIGDKFVVHEDGFVGEPWYLELTRFVFKSVDSPFDE